MNVIVDFVHRCLLETREFLECVCNVIGEISETWVASSAVHPLCSQLLQLVGTVLHKICPGNAYRNLHDF